MRWVLAAVAAVVALTIAAAVALPWIVDTPGVQSLIAAGATQALARPVKFRSVSVSVWPYPAVRLHGFEIAEDPAFGTGAFVRLDEADFRLKLWPLLRGQVEFTTLVLREPTITFVQTAAGRWNFASLGTAREPPATPRAPRPGVPGGPPPPALVSRIVVVKGVVTYERRTADGMILRQRLEDVDFTLGPRAGGLAFNGSAHVMPGRLAVKITEGTLGLAGARALTEASVRARIDVDGADVGPLTAGTLGGELALGGTLTGRLEIGGVVGRPRATGDVELRHPTVTRTSPTCAEPRRRTLALSTVKASVSWRDGRLVIHPLTSGLGRGTLTTRLAATPAPQMRAELSDLVLEQIPLERLLVDFVCQPYAVTGPLDLTGTLTLSLRDPLKTLAGSGRLSVGAGKVVGPRALSLLGGLVRAGVSSAPSLELPAVSSAPLEFDSIAGTYEIANGVVTTRDLIYSSRALKARVRGDYVIASSRVNADVVFDHDRGSFQAKLTGTADAPSIRVAPTLARHLDPQPTERRFQDLLKKFR